MSDLELQPHSTGTCTTYNINRLSYGIPDTDDVFDLVWRRHLVIYAQQLGVRKLLTGEERILTQPHSTAYTSNTVTEIRHDIYDRQQARVRVAQQLLHQVVPSPFDLRPHEYQDPTEALSIIMPKCEPYEAATCTEAYNRMENMRFDPVTSAQGLIQGLIECQGEIYDARGSWPEDHIVAKISRSLPAEYDVYVLEHITMKSSIPSIAEISSSIQAFERYELGYNEGLRWVGSVRKRSF